MGNPELSLLVCIFCVNIAFAHSVRYSVHVIDEVSGRALENIPCETIFTTRTGNWNDMSRGRLEKGLTNRNGDYTFTGESDLDHVTFSLRVEDGRFYPVIRRRMEFNGLSGALFKRWEPFDSAVTIRLQRVEHPIPLLVKYVRLADGKNGLGGESWTNCTFRYDLLKGDWLPPFGKGETGDLEINSRFELTGRTKMFMPQERKYGEAIYYTLHNTVSAASKDDRLEEVTLDPRSGIRIRCVEQKLSKNSLCFRIGEKKRFANNDKDYSGDRINDCEGDAAYVFRIRTQYDEKGRIKSAHYGKVYGKFQFQGNETVGLKSIEFLYYLNPTPLDRNLEWDMKTNLCPGKRQSVQKRP